MYRSNCCHFCMQSTWRRPQSCRRRLSSHNAPLSFLSSFNGFLMEDLRKVELVLPDSRQTDGILGKKKKGGYWSSGLIKQDCQFLEHTVTGTGPLQHHATWTLHHRVNVQLRGEVGVSVGSNNNLPRDDGISFGGNRPFWEHRLRRTLACPHTWEGPAWTWAAFRQAVAEGGGTDGGAWQTGIWGGVRLFRCVAEPAAIHLHYPRPHANWAGGQFLWGGTAEGAATVRALVLFPHGAPSTRVALL